MEDVTARKQSSSNPPWSAAAGGKTLDLRNVYATALLAAVSMLSFADRNILAVLLVPIQNDIGVSDAAMGALTGIAFSFVYATAALPAARLADRGNRRNVIAIAVAFWSAMTLVCGAAANYLVLLVGRIGVAVGEAAAYPSQISMVGDLFSPRRRGTALGFLSVGSVIGVSLGAFVAGVVNDHFGWQAAFVTLALPGFLLALVFYLTIREPARKDQEKNRSAGEDSQPWRAKLAYLFGIASFPGLILGVVLSNAASYGYFAWLPAYLMRVHGMTTSEMSLWFGLSLGVGGIFGAAIGGYLGDRLSARGARWRLYWLAIMMGIGVPFIGFIALSNNIVLVIGSMFGLALFGASAQSVCIAAGLDVVLPRLRGFLAAVIGFAGMFVGAASGPFIFGLMNDVLKPAFDDNAVRYTLLGSALFKILALMAFLWASRTSDRDAAAIQAASPAA